MCAHYFRCLIVFVISPTWFVPCFVVGVGKLLSIAVGLDLNGESVWSDAPDIRHMSAPRNSQVCSVTHLGRWTRPFLEEFRDLILGWCDFLAIFCMLVCWWAFDTHQAVGQSGQLTLLTLLGCNLISRNSANEPGYQCSNSGWGVCGHLAHSVFTLSLTGRCLAGWVATWRCCESSGRWKNRSGILRGLHGECPLAGQRECFVVIFRLLPSLGGCVMWEQELHDSKDLATESKIQQRPNSEFIRGRTRLVFGYMMVKGIVNIPEHDFVVPFQRFGETRNPGPPTDDLTSDELSVLTFNPAQIMGREDDVCKWPGIWGASETSHTECSLPLVRCTAFGAPVSPLWPLSLDHIEE